MVDRYYPDLNVDYAVFDGWQGGFELTTRLIQRGHEKIAFAISDEILPTSVHDRLSGYEAALEKGGVPYDENLVWLDVTLPTQTLKDHKTQHDLETKLCDQLLTEQPTGLVAVNYDVAEFLLNNLHALSLKADMPDYLLKTIEIGSFCHKPRPVNAPYVSVLAMQPGEILGVTAAEILVGRLSHKLQSTPQQIKLPMEIVEMRPIKS
jgi:LacI family transcriptional regulator